MSLMDVTSESLSRQLDREVPEVYVIIAKHSVLGMDRQGIMEVIDCEESDLIEIENDGLYREVRNIIGALHMQVAVDQTTGWDKLESLALKNLIKRAEMTGPHGADPEFMLKVAAVANKAARRASAGREHGILDPAAGQTAKINLTTRLVRSFTRDGGTETQTIEKQLSISDGSMKNPSFGEVDDLLSVHGTPALPQRVEISTSTPDVSFDELDEDMKEREK